jgi:hypothetical protein
MRTHHRVSAVIVGLAVAVAQPLHAQDPARGAALLAQARTAIGGLDKLAAIKRLQASGTFLRSTGPDQIIDGDFDVLIELPGKYRRNEITGFAGATVDRTEVLNGAEIWDETDGGLPRGGGGGGFGGGGFGRGGGGGGDRGGGDGGGFRGGGGGFGGGRQGQPRGGTDPAQAGQAQGGPQIDPARIKEQQRRVREAEMARLALVWLLTTEAPVTWIGTAESPEGTADVLEVKPSDGIATRVFLEPATHMPLMITWEGQAPRGNGLGARGTQRAPRGDTAPQGRRGGAAQGAGPQAQTTLEMHLAEYKVVNGIKLPHLITRGSDGVTQEEWKIKNFKINPNFKADTFTQ